ncbi:MAG: quinoprotein relay system zinc metallohydrolase 2 [Acetobacteraceae bacterium]|nr:quinoprotein relay system zinc metallohydrolase 2 [Acetobacteraceae bacterium]
MQRLTSTRAERKETSRRQAFGRRAAIAGGFCLCCTPAARLWAAESTDGLRCTEVAPGLFVTRGADEEATANNADAIANQAFIIGENAVAVIDPGGSRAHGAALRAAIRARTERPIRYVIITHVHPDHCFGAGAFLEDKPAFLGHARLIPALQARGAFYQRGLIRILGKDATGPIVLPTETVDKNLTLDLGNRPLSLHAHDPAHTDNDLSVIDTRTNTLLSGDLLFVRRMPTLDGSLKGWLAELAKLKQISFARVVPGHGPQAVPWPEAAADLERYLDILLTETRAAVRQNIGIDAAVDTVAQSEHGKWILFDAYHGRNVTEAYKELEWE